MQSQTAIRNGAQIYLWLVPLLTAALGFGVGHISYRLYVPIWLLNICLMAIAAWLLGGRSLGRADGSVQHLAAAALLLVVPWMLFSIFFGMGPLPGTAAAWASMVVEQQVRYALLIVGGVLATLGFGLLRECAKDAGEKIYSQLGFTAILIAVPLFILNMVFWGSYLGEAFTLFSKLPPGQRPDWYLPVRAEFGLVSTVEVGLTYMATAAFATSLQAAGWIQPTACRVYQGLSLLGLLLAALPPGLPEPLATAGYLVCVPAIPFIMPYVMGVNLLQRAGR
jgi:hypothetical protein